MELRRLNGPGLSLTKHYPMLDTSSIEAHVLAAERLHGYDTTVPILAKGKTDTGRIWTYVRDDRPFGGLLPPAAADFIVAYFDRRRKTLKGRTPYEFICKAWA